ncbi:hypothetical protein ACPB9E_32440 [Streptomyces exfoliatus]|uniref:hypothetical protein n=1 Tax=Streptomyces exfoliatus TaxID=1905 RepID=UPI003C2BF26F
MPGGAIGLAARTAGPAACPAPASRRRSSPAILAVRHLRAAVVHAPRTRRTHTDAPRGTSRGASAVRL